MPYSIHFSYEDSLLLNEKTKLRELEEHFQKGLKAPCGVTGTKVRWLAISDSSPREIQLRTVRGDQFMLKLESHNLLDANFKGFDEEDWNAISFSWPPE